MATTRGRLALSFVTAALAAGSLLARDPEETVQRAKAAGERLLAKRSQLGLDVDHDFHLRQSHSDRLGQTHGHFAQRFKGVRVWSGDAIAHEDAEGAELPLTSALHKNIRLNVTPSLEASEALAMAQQDLNPKGPFAYVPSVELVVYPQMVEVRRGNHRDREANAEDMTREVLRYSLAYHVRCTLMNPDINEIGQWDYMVDAHTGAILKKWDSLTTSDARGTGNTHYNGNVTLFTNSTTTGFELKDMTRGTGGQFGGNAVTNMNKTGNTSTGSSTLVGTIFTDADNTWGDGANFVETNSTTSANGQTAAADAAYAMQVSWDFFKNVLGRNGIDGTGKATFSRVHYARAYDNAFWLDACFCMAYGDGTSFKTLTSLDVGAHEMAHGVCANSANLTYSGEPGGLNESNSDIIGAVVEIYGRNGNSIPATVLNTDTAWTIGDQLASTPLRYMYKPSLDGSSRDAWSSTLGTIDVHFSSGPANRMFFFLSQGASNVSTTNYYSSYTPNGFTGIGPEKAVKIWYRALTTYMTSSTNYARARTACISAVKDLYLAGGAEEQAVWNAFAAINVGSAWTSTTPDTTAPTVTASESGTSGTISLSATATDNVGVTKVEFYIDNALVGTDTTSPYSVTYNSASLANGTHSLVAKAYDAAGNVGTSAAVNFSVNNTTTGTSYAEVESNGSLTAANLVADTVTTITGKIGVAGDNDYFKINVAAGRTVTVNMTGPAKDYDLYLQNSAGTVLKSSLGATATETVTYTNSGTTTAVYYIRVIGYSNAFDATNGYSLALTR